MTSRAVASRYARALFDVALAERIDLDQIDRDLSGFSDLVTKDDQLTRVLTNPAIPTATRAD